jgi:hypothetical protein
VHLPVFRQVSHSQKMLDEEVFEEKDCLTVTERTNVRLSRTAYLFACIQLNKDYDPNAFSTC